MKFCHKTGNFKKKYWAGTQRPYVSDHSTAIPNSQKVFAHFEFPSLAALSVELPLCKWPIFFTKQDFQKRHILSPRISAPFLSTLSNGSSTLARSCDQSDPFGAHITQLSCHRTWIHPVLEPKEDSYLLGCPSFLLDSMTDGHRSCLRLATVAHEQKKLRAEALRNTQHCPWSEHPTAFLALKYHLLAPLKWASPAIP